jgi:hypothetical protein
MGKYIITLAALIFFSAFIGCGSKDDESKTNFQVLADKEKELNDREARIRLKEIELEEREKKIGMVDNGQDTSWSLKDTTGVSEEKTEKKDMKEIQKEITKKFENPSTTVKDYYEYIQRAINETGNFDSNMKKAHNYFPGRSSEKMKASYKNTKSFTVIEEPKVISQKNDKAVVSSKVKQIEIVKKDGKDQEITRVMTVTYNLTANDKGEWVISGNNVKIEK